MWKHATAVVVALALGATGCLDRTPSCDDLTNPAKTWPGCGVPFERIDATRQNAARGVTLLRGRGDYMQFFGTAPPASVNFNEDWVLHFSTGVKPTGGFDAVIESVKRVGPQGDRTLIVYTADVSPGQGCMVTQALTNPQVTVVIKRQPGTPFIREVQESLVRDCPGTTPLPK